MKVCNACSASGHSEVRKRPILTESQLSVEMAKHLTNMAKDSNWRITTTGMMTWSFDTIEISAENWEFQIQVGTQTEARYQSS